MKNHLKEKMLAGERTLGTFFETGSAAILTSAFKGLRTELLE